MTYKEKLKDPRWQKKRLEIMQRDGFQCKGCGSKNKTLNVHHIRYFKNPWEGPDIYKITLCEDCHKQNSRMREHLQTIEASMGPVQMCKLVESIRESICIMEIGNFVPEDDSVLWLSLKVNLSTKARKTDNVLELANLYGVKFQKNEEEA